MTQSSSPPRRLRFGLRSLFVLVTVVSIATAWVTYSLDWIRQRRAALDRGDVHEFLDTGPSPPAAPCGLWLLGEEGKEVLWAFDVEQAVRLFPEAHIVDDK